MELCVQIGGRCSTLGKAVEKQFEGYRRLNKGIAFLHCEH